MVWFRDGKLLFDFKLVRGANYVLVRAATKPLVDGLPNGAWDCRRFNTRDEAVVRYQTAAANSRIQVWFGP